MTKKIKRNIVKICIGIVLFIIAKVVTGLTNQWVGLGVYIAAYLVLAYDVIREAAINIVHGQVFDEDFLMMVATFGAFFCGEFGEAVGVMLFFKIGETFEAYAVNMSRKSIKALMSIRPDFARIAVDGVEKEVDPEKVKIGDVIVIKPGERVPLDGKIIEGITSVDTSAITGESLPRDVEAGDTIVSGCVNQTGVIKVSVVSEFSQSTVSKVLSLVEDASAKKAKAEEFITVFARYYTPIIVISASLLAIIGSVVTGDIRSWLYRAMTFLLISCPCALVISIPLSFFGGIGGASRKGIMIKGGNYMDSLSKIDTLVLDKTGTLTKGNFAIAGVEVSDLYKEQFGDKAEEELLRVAAFVESYSTHPIAVSILKKYGKEIDKSLLSDVTEIAGKGVKALIDGATYYVGNKKLMSEVVGREFCEKIDECEKISLGGTEIFVAKEDRLAGHMHIIDEIKEDAFEALKEAKRAGIQKIIMLTGDNETTAKAVALALGVDEYRANLNPLEKVSAIEEIMSTNEGSTVAFVGDGINDAPVLARADVGIAMGAMGSDAAIEAADLVIMNDDLIKVSVAKKVAKKTLRIVKENIGFALGVKFLVLVFAALGIAHMGAAIFADVGVAFLCIMNAMRGLKK